MFYRLPFSQVCIFSFVFCSCFFCAAVLPLYLSTHHRRLFCSFEKPLAAVWVLFIVVFLRLRFVFLFASVVGGPKKKKEQVRMKHSTALHFIVFLLLLYLFVGGVLCSVVFPVVHFNFFSFSFTSLLSYIASLSDRNCYLLLFQCSFVVYNNGIVSTLFSLPPFLHEIVKSTGARGCGRDFFSASFTLHVSCPVLWVCLVDPEDDIQEVRPETQKKEGGEREKEWKRLQII